MIRGPNCNVGVTIPVDVTSRAHTEPEQRIGKIVQAMKDRNEIQDGDRVIYTTGEHSGIAGGTNSMMILTV